MIRPTIGMQNTCGILPPYLLEAIKLRGNEKQKAMAATLERQAQRYRDTREESAPAEPVVAERVLAAAEKPILQREVYDGGNRAALPGKLVRKEGDAAVEDAAVNEAYDGAGCVYELYRDIYQRNSIDGNGMDIISTVHHRRGFNNAFWNGEQMVYGDGDGMLFNRMTILSIIGHELSHGVVQFSGGLIYRDQSGALNESFADVFGSLTEQYKKKQSVTEASWLIGEGIFGENIDGVALRSLKAPGTAYNDKLIGKDPQPFHMDNYVSTTADNGGVHINSGIPNHAFYLLAQYLGGFAWEKAGQIWYDTMQAINNPMATFAEWADKTVEMARNRFGEGSIEMVMTRRAWKLIGINV